MKKRNTVLIVLAVFIVGAFIIKDLIIKSAVETAVRHVSGANVSIGGFSLGLMKQSIRIKDFRLYNPPGFPNEPMVDIPEIAVDYDLPKLIKGEIHLRYARLDLKEVRVVRNAKGELNVNKLKFAEQKPAPAGKQEPQKDQAPKKDIPMQLDLVSLNIGKVTMTDYTGGGQPRVNTYDVNIRNREFRNITNANTLGSLIIFQAVQQTAIKGVSQYLLNPQGAEGLIDQFKGLFK